MKSQLLATITLFTCTTEIFCAASSSSDGKRDTWLIDSDEEKGTWVIDTDDELTRVQGNRRIEDTVAYHLGMDYEWVVRDYEEQHLAGRMTCGPQAGHSVFGIAIINQPNDTSVPGWRTDPKYKRYDAIASEDFRKLSTQTFLEIHHDQQLNIWTSAKYPGVSINLGAMYPYLFLCSNAEEEVKVQELLTRNAQTVTTFAAALQLIYPNVSSSSTYILFDLAGYCGYGKKMEEERCAFQKRMSEL